MISEMKEIDRNYTCLATANLGDPFDKQRHHHALNVVWSDHLNAMTIGLNSSSISASVAIEGHGKCGHGCLLATWRGMRDIGAYRRLEN